MESKINTGEVYVSLDGEELILKPTILAARAVSRQFGGFGGALTQLGTANLDTLVAIIRIGANLDDRKARNLDQKVFDEMGRQDGAFGDLLGKAIRFVAILQNGGRPLPDDEAREADQSSQGSAEGNE